MGTDAQEGSALAMGFLDRFREKGASIVVTTHFDRLKAYGYLHPDVENVAVEFDEETLEPRYTLSYGSSGLSNAFLVAEKLGISESVLEKARHYREGGGQEISRVLGILERLKSETEKERIELHAMKEEVSAKRAETERTDRTDQEKKAGDLGSSGGRGKKSVHAIEEELKEWIRQKKEEKAQSNLLRVPCSPPGDSGHQGEIFTLLQRKRPSHSNRSLKDWRPCPNREPPERRDPLKDRDRGPSRGHDRKGNG